MGNIQNALQNLNNCMGKQDKRLAVPFERFIKILTREPDKILRNVFQIFHDMVKTYVDEGIDEYPDDPESIGFIDYDFSRLLVENADRPFFADRLFANRLMALSEAMKSGAQQNKIYIFDGPPGCGKSTFLNNLLKKFEEYANTEEGTRFETLWRLDSSLLGSAGEHEALPAVEKFMHLMISIMENGTPSYQESKTNAFSDRSGVNFAVNQQPRLTSGYIEIPCPSHDNPILMIPKHYRRTFFDELFPDGKFKSKLFNEKEYEWVFQDEPCTICSSLYQSFLYGVKNPLEVFKMIYARPYRINRRIGEGVSVFNPGDKPLRQNIISNPILQKQINRIFKGSNQIQYIYSRFAKTNNGIYALMDVKSNNTERAIELHNIISEGVHKVEDIEENVNSLFMAVTNPEDKQNIQSFKSFTDRIEYVNILYVLDLNTEVAIYRNIFGNHIDDNFLPRVLHNFARIIISSRMETQSKALLEWIEAPEKYSRYCDKNLQLLKMEIYAGHIPSWVSEEDLKRFTAKRRRRIIAEAETEGKKGFSGRESLKIFNEFYNTYAGEGKLINMSMLCNFFTKIRNDLGKSIPEGFLDSLLHMYNYNVLQQVKASLYYYNEEQISRDIQNYLFALNFEIGSAETCTFTGDKIEITEIFLESIENRLLSGEVEMEQRLAFRKDTQKNYTSGTLTQEIMLEKKLLTQTKLYQALHDRYVYGLKEKVLEPFLNNENFRRAIKDFNRDDFKSYDKRIKADVTFLIKNLIRIYKYTSLGAREICIYVIDNDLAKKY
ncbi:MAG: serine protein kinase [Desulfobacteraceae bacterium 4572_123]|nr:MAG: serine protein kinase [Desulfobacteraceae bacterium 4572_123]